MTDHTDVHSFIAGTCIMRAVAIGTKHSMEHVQTRGMAVLLSQIWQWFITTFKGCALLLLWVRNLITSFCQALFSFFSFLSFRFFFLFFFLIFLTFEQCFSFLSSQL